MREAHPARILVVENEAIVALELETRLGELGYRVAGTTSTGEEAVALAARAQPDLVLMDIRLGGELDGIAAAEQIHGASPGLPIVFLTAYADEDTVQRAKLTEPYGYLLKPFRERELTSTIEMALYKHRAERRQAAIERRYVATLDSIHDAVITTNAAGEVTLLNRAASQLTGFPPAGALGRPVDEIVRLEGIQRSLQVDLPVPEVGEGERLGDYHLLRGDGARPRVSLRAFDLAGEDGGPGGQVLVLEDVTRARSLEEQLLQAQKMEAVGRLAGGVAHDFNNMLTIMLSGTEMLTEELPEASTAREIVEEIKQAADRCVALTQQLLIFSRRQVALPTLLDVDAEVEGTRKLLHRIIGEDIRLSTSLEGNLPSIRLDPIHFQQLVMNLAVNARDAMPSGGTLRLATASAELGDADVARHRGAAPGRYVVLTVEDTGVGMDAETLAHVFEPFFTTKEKGKGTGLGLATVYEIVRQAGGLVTVDSTLGRGTAFHVHFPAATGQAASLVARARSPKGAQGSERVLLVEDEAQLRAMMSQTLRRSGYVVLEAGNAGEALLICEQSAPPPDVLVTDIVLPMMSGVRLAERLRALHPRLAVVYMSGYAAGHMEGDAASDGMGDATGDATARTSGGAAPRSAEGRPSPGAAFLPKPFTADALTTMVRAVLDQARGTP